MKKFFLCMMTACLTVSYGFAQVQSVSVREKFAIGVKAGVNASNVYDEAGENFTADPKLGVAAGAFAAIPLGALLGFHPEVLFSQKGFRATGSISGNGYEFTRTTNYLDVPLFVALKPVEMLTIVVGPQYSFLMRQKDTFRNSFINAEENEVFSNENLRRNTVCLAGGFDINLRHVVLGARAGMDLRHNRGDGSVEYPRYKNFWLQASLGIRIYNPI